MNSDNIFDFAFLTTFIVTGCLALLPFIILIVPLVWFAGWVVMTPDFTYTYEKVTNTCYISPKWEPQREIPCREDAEYEVP